MLPPGRSPILEALLNGLEQVGLPPVLINTSFNRRGEPIVNSAADAASSFRHLGLDFLVLGDHLIQASRA
jgi:carbamoyltransferase